MAQTNTFGKRLVGMVCTTFMVTGLVAQMYVNKEWAETTGLPDDIDWTATALDNEGNILVVGNTLQSPGNPDVLISKYNREGDLIWQRTYGGNAEAQDYGVAVATDNSGNCYVAGTVTNSGSSLDIAVLKYNAAGDLLWHTEWDGPSNLFDAPSSVVLDPVGNIYVAGTTYGSPTNPNYALLKLDPEGNLQWASSYDYAGFPDVATGVSFDAMMDPVVTGGSATAADAWDYATVRYNKASGVQSAMNRVNVPGVGLDNALAFSRSTAGDLYITGYREVDGEKDIQTVKLDNTFMLAWVVNYDGEGLADEGRAIGADNYGNVYVAGRTDKANGGSDFITIKYGPAGEVLWQRRYQAKKDIWMAEANKLAVTADGGVLVVGTIFDGDRKNFMTVKYTTDGKLEWEKEYNGLEGDAKGKDILVSTDGKVYVTGVTSVSGSASYTTVKYSSFKKDNGTLYDTTGEPFCVDRELIVKFRPNLVNPDIVNDKGWEYGELGKVIGADLTAQIEEKLGHVNGQKPLLAFKVFRRLKTTDQISITRLGEEEPMYEHWSTFLLTIPSPLDLMVARDSLSTMPRVIEYAEPNYLYRQGSVPNDPLLNIQHGLVPHPPEYVRSINCEPAWAIQTGQPYIKVGVIDHPVYWAHEEFGDGTFSGSKIKDGWDYVTNAHISNTNAPTYSHGTACAGIIGALSNNHTGISGIAGGDVDSSGNTGVHLISLGVFDNNDDPVSGGIIASAIVEASTEVNGDYGYGCNILNNSYYRYGSEDATMKSAVRTCWRNKCVFVACRGNEGSTAATYPAGYGDDDWVISVGASGKDGDRKRFDDDHSEEFWWATNWDDGMDVIAPGVRKLVIATEAPNAPLVPDEPVIPGYGYFNGTSAATPMVAGIAALLESEHNTLNGTWNNLSGEDVEHLIERTATDISGTYYADNNYTYSYPVGPDVLNGAGRVNAGASVQGVAQPYYRVVHSGSPLSNQQSTYPVQSVTVTGNAGDLENGTYNAMRIEVTHTYHDEFSATTQIIGHWMRSSSASGYPAGSTLDGSGGSWGAYNFTIQGSTATVVATTNCWHIVADAGNNPMDQWIPATPEEVRTAYSLYLHYGDDVGITTRDDLAGDLVLFPSPANDILNVQCGLNVGDQVGLKILDVDGRVVYDQKIQQAVKSTVYTIPIADLSQGMYVVRLSGSKGSRVKRFIKN